jgi:hypothetical protein
MFHPLKQKTLNCDYHDVDVDVDMMLLLLVMMVLMMMLLLMMMMMLMMIRVSFFPFRAPPRMTTKARHLTML